MSDPTPSAPVPSSSLPLPPRAGLPLVGAIPQLLPDPLGYILSARERYGDIYTLDLGAVRWIALNSPTHAQHILRDQARKYGKGGPVWDFVRFFSGNGLPTSEGELWKRQRRMLQPQFHRERIANMMGLVVDAIDETMAPWFQSMDSGEPFNASAAIARMTMNVIVKTMFGTGITPEETEIVSRELSYAFGYLIPGLVAQAVPGWLPFPGRSRFQKALKTVDEIVFRLIAQRRASGNSSPGGDLITMMLDLVDAETGARMSDQQLRDEAVSTFIAGYETTSTALSFALASLAQHPDIARMVSEECDTVLGNERPNLGHLGRMSRSLMVFQEALRLYPSAFWLPRTVLEDDVIDGYHIPKGSMVALFVYALQRHPKYWEQPERFDPWRFTPERSTDRHPVAWMPFGTGQRMCLGKDLALMEGQLILTRVLSHFELELAPGRPVVPELATTLRPKGGVWLRLRSRKVRSAPFQVAGQPGTSAVPPLRQHG